MSELGGLDSFSPDEGAGGAKEELSEEAKQRFAASAQAAKKARKQERKVKKKDKKVAALMKKFMGVKDDKLAVLMARLAARNCPSIFILAVVSLIDEEALEVVQEYLGENMQKSAGDLIDENMALTTRGSIDSQANKQLVTWITRMQMVLSTDPEEILIRLMIDEKNLDGTILQLTIFVIKRFFNRLQREAPFEKIQPLTASILQSVFEPFISQARKRILEERTRTKASYLDDNEEEDEDEEEDNDE